MGSNSLEFATWEDAIVEYDGDGPWTSTEIEKYIALSDGDAWVITEPGERFK